MSIQFQQAKSGASQQVIVLENKKSQHKTFKCKKIMFFMWKYHEVQAVHHLTYTGKIL